MPNMRNRNLPRKASLVVITLSALIFSGCGHVPIRSIPALAAIDFQTTQFEDLRAAIEMPTTLLPQPGGVRLNINLTIEGAVAEERSYALVQTASAQASEAHNIEPSSGRHAFIYRLSQEDQLGMDAIRRTMQEARQAGQSGSLSLRVSVEDICTTGMPDEDQLLIDVFLRTSETGSFVRTLNGYDLRELHAADVGLEENVRPCENS